MKILKILNNMMKFQEFLHYKKKLNILLTKKILNKIKKIVQMIIIYTIIIDYLKKGKKKKKSKETTLKKTIFKISKIKTNLKD